MGRMKYMLIYGVPCDVWLRQNDDDSINYSVSARKDGSAEEPMGGWVPKVALAVMEFRESVRRALIGRAGAVKSTAWVLSGHIVDAKTCWGKDRVLFELDGQGQQRNWVNIDRIALIGADVQEAHPPH